MKIYLGIAGTREAKRIKEQYGCGWSMTPTNYKRIFRGPFIIDNGAFAAWKNGVKWDEIAFYDFLREFISFKPDFTVVPDIVAAGEESLRFSLQHVDRIPRPRYLAVQDGMRITPPPLTSSTDSTESS
jgi:hypothetical protein